MADAQVQNAPGQLRFGTIERLADDWWTSPPPNDPQAVWNTWDRDTYYLWGANSGNYQGIAIGQLLGGGGMAGTNGPSRGRAHPHYVGVITMDVADLPKNDPVFQELAGYMANGKNVVAPTFHGEWSLGTGIGKNIPNWGDIQKYLLSHVYSLGQAASGAVFPPGTYWPDWRPGMNGVKHPIASMSDLLAIIQML